MDALLHASKEEVDGKVANTCRFCGCVDTQNVEIFSANKADDYHRLNMDQEDLLHKICTVFPFLMYENDPLPQHICPECIDIVCSLYRDIQQVLVHQKNIMKLIKAEKPDHEYFRILNSIEKSIEATKQSIKKTYDVEINRDIALKLFTAQKEPDLPTNTTNTINQTETNDTPKPVNDSLVKNIQTKLELNGFTIKRIKVATPSTNKMSSELSSEDNLIAEVNTSCSYCDQWFPTPEALALHQVVHMKLSTPKIFEKRLLPKNLRRGRLITINNEKNIRCLNCWQIFKDNKAILQHWSESDCHFYCFLCGQEFPHSPKQLREHMTEVHGISFRSVAKQFVISHLEPPKLFEEVKEPSVEKTSAEKTIPWKIPMLFSKTISHHGLPIKKPSKKKRYYYKTLKSSTKHDDGTFSCNVCHKVFNNYRSSNSHMRVHYVTDICASANRDVYSKRDDGYEALESPPKTGCAIKPSQTPIILSTYSAVKPIRPPYKITDHNDSLRGIKTKIVPTRYDFLANNGGNDSLLTSHRDWVPSTSDSDQFIIDECSISSGLSNNYAEINDFALTSPLSMVKQEPPDNADVLPTNSKWNCFICKEDFSTSKEYEMHAMFVHNIN